MKILLLTLLVSFSVGAQGNSLSSAIRNTNLLEMENSPEIKFKAQLNTSKTFSCHKKENGSLLVTIQPHHWEAQGYIGQVYSFCRVMHECDNRIVCPSLRSYKKKDT